MIRRSDTGQPCRRGGGPWLGVLPLGAVVMGLACAGPPWFLGAPLDGHPAIPPQSRALTVAEHRRAADSARRGNQRVIELVELFALEERGALRSKEKERLIRLLTLRTRDWVALGRPIPLGEDLRHLTELVPGRASLIAPRLGIAELAAGDEWLAIGENGRAEEAYRLAQKLGSPVADFRFRAAWGAPVADLDNGVIERAMSELPARVLGPFTRQYLDRAPVTKPRLLKRGWLAARLYGPPALRARIEALPEAERFRDEALEARRAVEAAKLAEADESAKAHGGRSEEKTSGAATSATPGEPTGKSNDLATVEAAEAGSLPASPLEPASGDLLFGGVTLAKTLLPAVAAFPRLIEPGPRSRAWAERLVAEDPTSPDSWELAALIDARAGRLGGAARKLVSLVFFSGDRGAGYERAARVWQRAGQPRLACAAWDHATRVGAPDDPRWCELLACVEQDPGAGDVATIAAHIRKRAPTLVCATFPVGGPGQGPGAASSDVAGPKGPSARPPSPWPTGAPAPGR